MLAYFMGKNTPERQQFIIENLRVEADIVEGEDEGAEGAVGAESGMMAVPAMAGG